MLVNYFLQVSFNSNIIQFECPVMGLRYHTLLLRFGDILGELGRATACIKAKRSRAKIPMARSNEPGMLLLSYIKLAWYD